MKTCDIAIIGGGLVGASLACALSPLGLDVTLIEAVPFRATSQPSYDDRTLALSASSCQILRGLGIWPSLQANATAIREIHVREMDRPGRVVMKPQELGLDRFGHVVEARVFGAAVMGLLPELPNLDVVCPASVSALEVDAEAARITCQDESETYEVAAKLVVGADGAHSFIRQALSIESEHHDYGQTAVICNITPEQDHQGRAFERFTPTGPFAVMPHVAGRCGLIWCVSTGQAEELLEWSEERFLSEAQALFGNTLGKFVRIGQRSSYPLHLVRAREDIRPRGVILGNAAHAIHPIGAQGFNLGLRDVAVLAEVLHDELSVNPQADPGRLDLLRKYSQWRASDQQGTISYSDGMARIFSNPSPFAAAARTAGLFAHALLPPLRRQLAIRSMGFRGAIPRLALGESLGELS